MCAEGALVRDLREEQAPPLPPLHFRTISRLRTISLSLPERGVINFSLFERKVTKEANEPAVRSPRRAGYRPRKFRPHLTQGFSVQMGCRRRTKDYPNHRFFPTMCIQQSLIFITRPARRMGTDGACAWEHFSRLCPLSVTFRDTADCQASATPKNASNGESHPKHFLGLKLIDKTIFCKVSLSKE